MEAIIRAASVAATPRLLRRAVTRVGTESADAGRAQTGAGAKPGAGAFASGSGMPTADSSATPRSYAAAPAAGLASATASVPRADDDKAVYERELARLAEAQQEQQSAQNLQLQQQREVQLQQARAAAEKLGFAEGLAKGEQAAQQQLQQQVTQLAKLMAQLNQTRQDMVNRAEDTMVEIVYEALCRIAGQNLGQRAMVLAMVQQVLQEFRQHEPLVLLLHPQDLALVQQALPELGIDPEQTQLRADPSLKMGGCVVESAAGTLDASLETQFSRLRDALLQVRRGEEYTGEMQ